MQLSLSLFYLVKHNNYQSHVMFLIHIRNVSSLNLLPNLKREISRMFFPSLSPDIHFLSLSFRIILNIADAIICVPRNWQLEQFCKQKHQQLKEIPTKEGKEMPFSLFPSEEQLEEKGLFFRNRATTLYSSYLIM